MSGPLKNVIGHRRQRHERSLLLETEHFDFVFVEGKQVSAWILN